MNYVVQDGKSNWLEGMILMCKFQLYFGLRSRSKHCRSVFDLGRHILVLSWYVANSDEMLIFDMLSVSSLRHRRHFPQLLNAQTIFQDMDHEDAYSMIRPPIVLIHMTSHSLHRLILVDISVYP